MVSVELGGDVAAGHGEEDIVEVGGVDREAFDVDAGRRVAVEELTERVDAAVCGDLEDELVLVVQRPRKELGGRSQQVESGEVESDVAARDTALQFGGGSFGDDPAFVEHGDTVGQLVGLVEVLGGEQDGDPGRGELADDLPHGQAASGVQAGGGLVEEDHPGLSDQGHRQVEAASHPARVGRQQLVRGVGEVELLQQLSDPSLTGRPAEVAKVGHQLQVLRAGEQVVDGRELTGDPDDGPYPVGVGDNVVTGDAHGAGIGRDQGGENADHRGLAGPVGAEKRQDHALLNGQAHIVEHQMVAERLAHGPGHDPVRCGLIRHGFLLRCLEAAGGDVAVGGGRMDVRPAVSSVVLERVVDPAVGGVGVQTGRDSVGGADQDLALLGAQLDRAAHGLGDVDVPLLGADLRGAAQVADRDVAGEEGEAGGFGLVDLDRALRALEGDVAEAVRRLGTRRWPPWL